MAWRKTKSNLDTAAPPKVFKWKRIVLRILLSGVFVASALTVPAFVYDLADYLSAVEVFRQIRLGMSREELVSLLERKKILCGYSGIPERALSACQFSDFWRDYFIVLDPRAGHVTRKHFFFKRRPNPVNRLIALISNRP